MTVTHPSPVRDGFRLGLPFALGTLGAGIAFGALAPGVGIAWPAAIGFSLVAYSGTAQFATISSLGAGGSLAALLVTVLALNARYLAFGGSVASSLSRNRLARLVEAQLIVDASWALALRARDRRAVLVGAGLASLLGWLAGTILGLTLGAAIGDGHALGIDVAVPVFFVSLLFEGRASVRVAVRAVSAGALVVLLAPFLPVGVPLLVVFVVALATAGAA
jgi:predicted branched-subunit amino acid permease